MQPGIVALVVVVVVLLGSLLFVALRSRGRIGDLETQLKAERERLRLEAAQRQSEFKFLVSLSESLSSVLSKDRLMRLVLEGLLRATSSEMGFLLVYNYAQNEYVYETGFHLDRTLLRSTSFPSFEGILNDVARKKELLPVDDVSSVIDFLRPERIGQLGPCRARWLVPLVIEGEVLGIAAIYCAPEAHELIKQRTDFLKGVASQVSVGLSSAIQCELAITDRLTRVYNHGHFQNRLQNEMARCRRYHVSMSVILVDIDHFKQVNDRYGHQQGDLVLREVARLLAKGVRLVDLCARYGGEEFALLLPETDSAGAAVAGERVRRMIEEYHCALTGKDGSLRVTVSMGLAAWRWPDDKETEGELLIRRADSALYQAKEQGRNRVVAYAGEEKGGSKQ